MAVFSRIKKDLKSDFFDYFMFFSPFLIGIFFEWTSCICSCVLTVYLIKKYFGAGKLYVPFNLVSAVLMTIVSGYILSCFWAVDPYDAFFGVLKFMPVVLFYIAVCQKKDRKNDFLRAIPYSGALMTVISLCLKPVPFFYRYFYNADRLTGFFQYANTYALFLLTGIILILFSEKINIQKIIILLILLFGIFESGSRTVFVLTFLTVSAISIYRKDIRKPALISFGSILIAAVLIVFLTHRYSTVGRFLTTSLTESSLLGRLLYYKDGLSIIKKHPFGLGYLGYYYYQSEIQTGRYIVKFIHNDFLQFAVDIGIIPAVMFAVAVFRSFFSKEIPAVYKFITAVIAAHCMLDFDLQFLTVFFVLIVSISGDEKNLKVIKKKHRPAVCASSLAGICFCLYFGIALGLNYFGCSDLSYRMYSKNTEIEIEYLREADTLLQVRDISEKIISHNKNVALAYDAQALIARNSGKYEQMISYKKEAVRAAKYNINEYYDYFRLLKSVLDSGNSKINPKQREVCIQALLEIPELMKSVENNSDPLAWRINDKPNLVPTEEMTEYIKKIKR